MVGIVNEERTVWSRESTDLRVAYPKRNDTFFLGTVVLVFYREMVALWALADVALVTSLREGVNLGAMEFVACQQTSMPGVLVYRWERSTLAVSSPSKLLISLFLHMCLRRS